MIELLQAITSQEDMMHILHFAIDLILKSDIPIKTLIASNMKLKKYQNHESEIKSISTCYLQYCLNQIKQNELLEYFPGLPEEYKDSVLNAIEVRKETVTQQLLNQHNNSNIPVLKSFDWELNWTIGSSSLASHREQTATLILNCKNKSIPECLTVEMNRDNLNKMIEELENHVQVSG